MILPLPSASPAVQVRGTAAIRCAMGPGEQASEFGALLAQAAELGSGIAALLGGVAPMPSTIPAAAGARAVPTSAAPVAMGQGPARPGAPANAGPVASAWAQHALGGALPPQDPPVTAPELMLGDSVAEPVGSENPAIAGSVRNTGTEHALGGALPPRDPPETPLSVWPLATGSSIPTSAPDLLTSPGCGASLPPLRRDGRGSVAEPGVAAAEVTGQVAADRVSVAGAVHGSAFEAEPVAPAGLAERVAALARRRSDGTEHVVVRLDPPELGTVRISVIARGDQVQVVVRAETPEARAALDAQRSEVETVLQNEGFDLSSFDAGHRRRDQDVPARSRRPVFAATFAGEGTGPEPNLPPAADGALRL